MKGTRRSERLAAKEARRSKRIAAKEKKKKEDVKRGRDALLTRLEASITPKKPDKDESSSDEDDSDDVPLIPNIGQKRRTENDEKQADEKEEAQHDVVDLTNVPSSSDDDIKGGNNKSTKSKKKRDEREKRGKKSPPQPTSKVSKRNKKTVSSATNKASKTSKSAANGNETQGPAEMSTIEHIWKANRLIRDLRHKQATIAKKKQKEIDDIMEKKQRSIDTEKEYEAAEKAEIAKRMYGEQQDKEATPEPNEGSATPGFTSPEQFVDLVKYIRPMATGMDEETAAFIDDSDECSEEDKPIEERINSPSATNNDQIQGMPAFGEHENQSRDSEDEKSATPRKSTVTAEISHILDADEEAINKLRKMDAPREDFVPEPDELEEMRVRLEKSPDRVTATGIPFPHRTHSASQRTSILLEREQTPGADSDIIELTPMQAEQAALVAIASDAPKPTDILSATQDRPPVRSQSKPRKPVDQGGRTPSPKANISRLDFTNRDEGWNRTRSRLTDSEKRRREEQEERRARRFLYKRDRYTIPIRNYSSIPYDPRVYNSGRSYDTTPLELYTPELPGMSGHDPTHAPRLPDITSQCHYDRFQQPYMDEDEEFGKFVSVDDRVLEAVTIPNAKYFRSCVVPMLTDDNEIPWDRFPEEESKEKAELRVQLKRYRQIPLNEEDARQMRLRRISVISELTHPRWLFTGAWMKDTYLKRTIATAWHSRVVEYIALKTRLRTLISSNKTGNEFAEEMRHERHVNEAKPLADANIIVYHHHYYKLLRAGKKRLKVTEPGLRFNGLSLKDIRFLIKQASEYSKTRWIHHDKEHFDINDNNPPPNMSNVELCWARTIEVELPHIWQALHRCPPGAIYESFIVAYTELFHEEKRLDREFFRTCDRLKKWIDERVRRKLRPKRNQPLPDVADDQGSPTPEVIESPNNKRRRLSNNDTTNQHRVREITDKLPEIPDLRKPRLMTETITTIQPDNGSGPHTKMDVDMGNISRNITLQTSTSSSLPNNSGHSPAERNVVKKDSQQQCSESEWMKDYLNSEVGEREKMWADLSMEKREALWIFCTGDAANERPSAMLWARLPHSSGLPTNDSNLHPITKVKLRDQTYSNWVGVLPKLSNENFPEWLLLSVETQAKYRVPDPIWLEHILLRLKKESQSMITEFTMATNPKLANTLDGLYLAISEKVGGADCLNAFRKRCLKPRYIGLRNPTTLKSVVETAALKYGIIFRWFHAFSAVSRYGDDISKVYWPKHLRPIDFDEMYDVWYDLLGSAERRALPSLKVCDWKSMVSKLSDITQQWQTRSLQQSRDKAATGTDLSKTTGSSRNKPKRPDNLDSQSEYGYLGELETKSEEDRLFGHPHSPTSEGSRESRDFDADLLQPTGFAEQALAAGETIRRQIAQKRIQRFPALKVDPWCGVCGWHTHRTKECVYRRTLADGRRCCWVCQRTTCSVPTCPDKRAQPIIPVDDHVRNEWLISRGRYSGHPPAALTMNTLYKSPADYPWNPVRGPAIEWIKRNNPDKLGTVSKRGTTTSSGTTTKSRTRETTRKETSQTGSQVCHQLPNAHFPHFNDASQSPWLETALFSQLVGNGRVDPSTTKVIPPVSVIVVANGQVVSAILDTGASSNFVTPRVVRKFKWNSLVRKCKQNRRAMLVEGSTELERWISLDVELGPNDEPKPMSFYVNGTFDCDLLFGRSGLRQLGLMAKFRDLVIKSQSKVTAKIHQREIVGGEFSDGNDSFFHRVRESNITEPALSVEAEPSNQLDQDLIKRLRSEEECSKIIKDKLNSTLTKYESAFAQHTTDVGLVKGAEHIFRLKLVAGATPTHHKPYRLPPKQEAAISNEVTALLKHDIIRPCQSAWAAPPFCVAQKDGRDRIVYNFKKLNDVTVFDPYPMRSLESLSSYCRGNSWFASFDIKRGFWHIQVHPEDQDMVAFTTNGGQYAFKRLPFGLKNAPASFQRMMDSVFGDEAFPYIDDILVAADSESSLLRKISRILAKAVEFGIKLNPEKCKFFRRSLIHLGRRINHEGIGPDPQYISTINNLATPETAGEVTRLISMVSWLRQFVPNIADPLSIISSLTHGKTKQSKVEWNETHDEAFRYIKKLMINPSTLVPVAPKSKLKIQADASDLAIGAVLLQFNEERRRWEPAEYYSRMLSKSEKRWSINDKETLAIVNALEKWRRFLITRYFVVETDHSNVSWLWRRESAITDPKALRWLVRIQEFAFELNIISGADNFIADFFSRSTQRSSEETKEELLEMEERLPQSTNITDPSTWVVYQMEDTDLSEIHGAITRNRPTIDQSNNDELIRAFKEKRIRRNEEEILEIRFKPRRRRADQPLTPAAWLWIVPRRLRRAVMERHHNYAGSHLGGKALLTRLRSAFWWPGMTKDVLKYCVSCPTCQRTKDHRRKHRSKMRSFEKEAPFESLIIDFMGPYPSTDDQYRYVLSIMDFASRLVRLIPTKEATANEAAMGLLEKWFYKFGVPRRILSDRGRHFINESVAALTGLLGCQHNVSTAYHPHTQGRVERMHRWFSERISMTIDESLEQSHIQGSRAHLNCVVEDFDWTKEVDRIEFGWNSHPMEVWDNKISPLEFALGIKARPLTFALWRDQDFSELAKSSNDEAKAIIAKLHIDAAHFRADFQRREVEIDRRRKKSINKRNKVKEVLYGQGQKVLVWDLHGKQGTKRKWLPNWSSHFVVEKREHPNVYRVKNERTGESKLVNAIDLRPWVNDESGWHSAAHAMPLCKPRTQRRVIEVVSDNEDE